MRFFSQKSGFLFQALKLETFFSGLLNSGGLFLLSYSCFVLKLYNHLIIIIDFNILWGSLWIISGLLSWIPFVLWFWEFFYITFFLNYDRQTKQHYYMLALVTGTITCICDVNWGLIEGGFIPSPRAASFLTNAIYEI